MPRKVTAPWCTCGKKPEGFVAHPTLDSKWWVHSGCLRPTKMFWEKHRALRPA